MLLIFFERPSNKYLVVFSLRIIGPARTAKKESANCSGKPKICVDELIIYTAHFSRDLCSWYVFRVILSSTMIYATVSWLTYSVTCTN